MTERRNLESAIATLLVVTIGLTIAQIAAHPVPAKGAPSPVLLGAVVVSVLVRMLIATMLSARARLPYVLRAGDVYVMVTVAALLYVAAANTASRTFGWWLAGALILYALWLFVLFAARNAAGDAGEELGPIDDWMTISGISGVATIAIWSLHVSGTQRGYLLAGFFLAATLYEFWAGRNAEARSLTV